MTQCIYSILTYRKTLTRSETLHMTTQWDTIVVGAGPAGLSAALYASRAGLSTLLITGDTPGGLLTTTETIDNYLGMPEMSGEAMAETFFAHAQKFGATVIEDETTHIYKNNGNFTVVTANGSEIMSQSVVYAAGSTPRKLHVPGEDLSGVSYCATCDGIFFAGDDVVLVGGGETAAEDALYLSALAESVTVLVRRDEWRASAPAVERLQDKENVHIRMSTEVEKIVGTEDVEGVQLSNGEQLTAEGVFIAVGQNPNSAPAQDMTVLYTDGFIEESLHDGFFVAGDVGTDSHRQVAIAVGDGARAGMDATDYVLKFA